METKAKQARWVKKDVEMDGNNAIASDINNDSLKRTKGVNRQTALSFFLQAASVFLNFLIVPITIKFLNQEIYGIWITLLSIISWVSLMDLGIGLGLRNRLTEAIAKNDMFSARQYVSTAYISVCALMIPFLIVCLILTPFFNWNSIFNITTLKNSELANSVCIVLIGTVGVFILGLINQIFNALQKNALVALHPIFVNAILLLVLYFKPHYLTGLLFMSLAYVIISLTVLFAITMTVFNRHKQLRPGIKYFDKTKVRFLLSLGFKFFIIQIAVVVIFSTDNLIIAHVLGPKEVTGYQITKQVFGVLSMIASLIMGPLWSAYTDAYIKSDFAWIRAILKKLMLLMIPFVLGTGILIFFFKDIVSIWIKQDLNISSGLIFYMGIYTIIAVWNNLFGFVLGGIGKIRLSTFSTVFSMLINIPLSIYFAHRIGVTGVIIGTISSLVISSVLSPIQTYVFIFSKKKNEYLMKILS